MIAKCTRVDRSDSWALAWFEGSGHPGIFAKGDRRFDFVVGRDYDLTTGLLATAASPVPDPAPIAEPLPSPIPETAPPVASDASPRGEVDTAELQTDPDIAVPSPSPTPTPADGAPTRVEPRKSSKVKA